MAKKEISRRSFLKGTAAGLLAAAGSAVLRPAAYADDVPTMSFAPDKWDYEADVVICGCGVAGAMAARETVRQGKSCLILEKASKEMAGGASCCFGGYYVPYPVEALLYSGNGKISPEDGDAIVAQMTDDYTWMLYNGMTVNAFYKVDGAGRGFYAVLQNAIDAMQTPVLYETPVKSLVQDPGSGEVVGVIAEDSAKNRLAIRARKGVILATGSMAGSKELLSRFFLPDGIPMANTNSPANTGDGFVLGMQAGAALHNMGQHGVELTHFALKKASDELGTGIACYPYGPNRGAQIIVNQRGERFMNEETNLTHNKDLLDFLKFPGNAQTGYEGFVNLPAYLIVDEQIFDTEGLGSYLNDYTWTVSKDIYTWSADNRAELDKGWIVKGDTVEELAARLSESSGNAPIDAAALQAAIDGYNLACEEGKDAFGRSNLQPLGPGPYYAAELMPSLMYTIGGLDSSTVGQTLDWSGKPIPRLYSVGDIGQLCEISPMGACGCGAMGALAARDALKLDDAQTAGEADKVIEAPGDTAMLIAAGGLYALYPAAEQTQQEESESTVVSVSTAEYRDGTYTGTGTSMIGGEIRVTVAIRDGRIADIQVDSHNETPTVGGLALAMLTEQAVLANSSQIDGVSGATETSKGFAMALADALSQAE